MLPLNSKPSKLKTNLKNKRDLENFNNTNLEQESYKKDRHAVK